MSETESSYFEHEQARWHYYTFGTGKKALIAMHGFGQNGKMFEVIAPAFAEEYTIYAFDFIIHGKTEWNSEEACKPKNWANMLDAFAVEKNIKAFSLMGFSMGGKIFLHSLLFMKTPIKEIFPIAMDGVKLGFYHRPFLRNSFVEGLVKKIIFNSAWTLKLTPILLRMNLISKQASDFMHYYFENERRKMRSYMVWKSMLYFLSPLEEITAFIEENKIKMHILFGKKDKILSPKTAKKLHKLIPSSTLNLVDGGHFIVDESLNPIIRHILAKQ